VISYKFASIYLSSHCMLFLVTPKQILSIVYQIQHDPFNAMDSALQIMHYPLRAATYFDSELLRIYVPISNIRLSLSTPSGMNAAYHYLSIDYHPFDLSNYPLLNVWGICKHMITGYRIDWTRARTWHVGVIVRVQKCVTHDVGNYVPPLVLVCRWGWKSGIKVRSIGRICWSMLVNLSFIKRCLSTYAKRIFFLLLGDGQV